MKAQQRWLERSALAIAVVSLGAFARPGVASPQPQRAAASGEPVAAEPAAPPPEGPARPGPEPADGAGATPGSLPQALTRLHQVDVAAMHGARLARRNSRSRTVTHLAQMIAADHRAMDDALLASAKARGTPIAPAWTLAPANTPPLSELAKLEGATFDGPFVNWLVENEARAVAAATDAATQAKAAGDTALAARVERAIPRLRDHVASAQRLKDELAAQQANRGGSPP